MLDAYVVDAVRTPRGKAKASGGLHGYRPVALVSQLLAAVEARVTGVRDVADDVVLGCVTQVGDQGANVAKIATLYAGWPDAVPGITVNRFCCSGLDAVAIAATRVHAGMGRVVCAGGVESMSRVPMFADKGAWFADAQVAAATGYVHMVVAADLVAQLAGIARAELDAYAVRSHRRAAQATDEGHFARSLVPVPSATDEPFLDHDELIRAGTTTDALAALAPLLAGVGSSPVVLARYPHVAQEPLHTIGTAPGMADGASLAVIANREGVTALGIPPRARLRAIATCSVEPVQMLHGNMDATRKALDTAGLAVADVDLFEVNESFAAVPIQFARTLGIDETKLNISGGAIAMGHPIGATGGMLLATLVDNLHRTDGTIGVASICGGAGVATAIVVERV